MGCYFITINSFIEGVIIVAKKLNRNSPCPCGSGKKYKKCCWDSDQKKELGDRKLSNMVSENNPYCKKMGGIFSNLKNMNKSLKELQEEAKNLPEESPDDPSEMSELKKIITKG